MSYSLEHVANACRGTVKDIKSIIFNDDWAGKNQETRRFMNAECKKLPNNTQINEQTKMNLLTGQDLLSAIDKLQLDENALLSQPEFNAVMFSFSQNRGVLESFRALLPKLPVSDADKALFTHLAYLNANKWALNEGENQDAVYKLISALSEVPISVSDFENNLPGLYNGPYGNKYREIFNQRNTQEDIIRNGMNMDLGRYRVYSGESNSTGGSRKRRNRRSVSRKSNRSNRRRSNQRRNNRY